MRKPFFCLSAFLAVLIPFVVFAGKTGAVYGSVVDEKTGEVLIGVNLLVDGTLLGAASDYNGYYIIEDIPIDSQKIVVRMMGYETDTFHVKIMKNKAFELNIGLKKEIIDLPGVVVSGEKLIERSAVSDHVLKGKSFILREGPMQDPIKVIHTLPGVAAMGDIFSPGLLYVRGGGPDENLFLLDWSSVEWPWHFGGMKSVFNSDIIESIELQTGGFPAKYGNALSSVFNITTREGNRERFSGNVSLGFINMQTLVEGPITSKGFFLLAGRRTYIDLVMQESDEFPIPYFWDGNFKLGYDINAANKIYLSGLVSYELIDFTTDDPESGMPEKIYDEGKLNTQSLEWKSIINENLYSVFALTREKNIFHIDIGSNMKIDIDAVDLGFIEDLTWTFNHSHTVKTGVKFDLGIYDFEEKLPLDLMEVDIDLGDSTVQTTIYDVSDTVWDAAFYIQDSWTILDDFSVTGGFRFDYWDLNEIFDVSPRFSLRYRLSDGDELRFATGLFTQHPGFEVASRNGSLDSRRAIHYILGVRHKFDKDLSGWIELYEKDYKNLVIVDTLENYLSDGKGYARGVEFFLKRDTKKFSGWLSYSLGLAKRREFLDDVENYADFDQRHMLSALLDWEINKRITLGLQFRYASGSPYTPTVAAVLDSSGSFWVPVKGERNSARYAPYHQLNLRLSFNYTFLGLKSSSYFEVWNVYNRKNIMGYTYEYGSQYENNVNIEPYYSLPILPSGGFRIYF
jgi:outer membrane receptor protein involved in Fe transport